MALRIVAFDSEHVPAAAQLLAERHTEHRRHEPLLPASVDFVRLVSDQLAAGSGFAALRNGELVGYLLGEESEDNLGKHVRIGPASWATAEPELAPELYTEAASRWVEAQLTRHFVFVPSLPALIEPWYRLCFGASAALAMRDLKDETGLACPPSTIKIRPSSPADLQTIAALGVSFDDGLNASPSFAALPQPSIEQQQREWSDLWTDERMECFVAELGGEVIGQILLYQRPEDLRVPPSSIDLGYAVVSKEHRGKGVGLLMTRHVVERARHEGYKVMTTDWRWTNRSAARFWPRRGFREVFTRLYRSIP